MAGQVLYFGGKIVTNVKYESPVDRGVNMYIEFGVKIFFSGLGVTCLHAFPVNAVTLLLYSHCLKLLEGNLVVVIPRKMCKSCSVYTF